MREIHRCFTRSSPLARHWTGSKGHKQPSDVTLISLREFSRCSPTVSPLSRSRPDARRSFSRHESLLHARPDNATEAVYIGRNNCSRTNSLLADNACHDLWTLIMSLCNEARYTLPAAVLETTLSRTPAGIADTRRTNGERRKSESRADGKCKFENYVATVPG